MAKVYYDDDANMQALKGKTIAIIGYGIQGRAQGLNLKDSGCQVVVADVPGSRGWRLAEEDGQKVMKTEEAAAAGSIVQILTEDHVQAKVYETQVKQHMSEGDALFFSHGFNIHFGQIRPAADIDVVLVAPKGPGSLVRDQYLKGGGVPSLLAIYQDHTGNAREIGLAYAKAIGGTRGGVIETTFREETETDLFGEQAVLCGGLAELITAGFDTLVEAGYQPEMAYYECCHEVKLIMDMVFKYGIAGMRSRVSNTAAYGDMTRGKRIISEDVRDEMREMLREIQDGEFAREWILECQAGRPVFKRLWEQSSETLIEQVGGELRDRMPWLEDM